MAVYKTGSYELRKIEQALLYTCTVPTPEPSHTRTEMVKIALAGGTSGIGLAIHNALKAQDSHEFVLFTRTLNKHAQAVVVDYTSVSSLARALKAHSIHTVISAISISDEASGVAQLNLIDGCISAGCVKRFLPSEFGADYKEEYDPLPGTPAGSYTVSHEIYRSIQHTPSYVYKFKARKALAETNLEYSIVSIGMFLDYWGHPHMPTVLDPRNGTSIFIDLAHNFAAIPGSGETFMVLTHSTDAARFVVAMMSLPEWSRSTFFAGDRLNLREFLQRAEETKGVKFEVHFDETETIRAGNATLPPNVKEWLPSQDWTPFFSKIAMTYLDGGLDLDMTKCRNDLFPEIMPLRVQDILDAWKGK